jgi:DNA-binding transcriptional regulator YiaG
VFAGIVSLNGLLATVFTSLASGGSRSAGKVCMQVIAQWTGGHADALRQSLRMGNESFADYLGVVVRTVAYWRKRPEMIPRPHMQGILDTALDKSPERVKAQFAALVSEMSSHAADANSLSVPVGAMTTSLYASGPDADERARIRGVLLQPSRLDEATVAHLTRALYGQRHAEDSLGPGMMIDPMKAQLDALVTALRGASGPHKAALMHLVANWMTFIGWLHTALREYPQADATFAIAEEMSDELGDGILATTATSYRGYIALLQGHHRPAIRATVAALGTPGAHPTQVAYDTLQTAQAYAGLGDLQEAKNLLHRASDLVTNAGEPPESLYWYTEPFLRMNVGLTQNAIGQYRDAVDSIRSGIAELPGDQQNADWLGEYRQALGHATGQTDGHPISQPE